MKRLLISVAALSALFVSGGLFMSGTILAQNGHFLTGGNNAPVCTDIGTQVHCTGKVAGLGGTTFQIDVQAAGIATVECINPGGRRAPGQDTTVTVAGTSGPLATPQNGQYPFSIMTVDPGPLPSTPTCPNPKWIANVVDVTFTTATLTLRENGTISDTVTVPVQ